MQTTLADQLILAALFFASGCIVGAVSWEMFLHILDNITARRMAKAISERGPFSQP